MTNGRFWLFPTFLAGSLKVDKTSSNSNRLKLAGVRKRKKKEKMFGRFSVERFQHCDKDIEYYTGFTSYKTFESFFRSLEVYVDKLRVTDIMHGVLKISEVCTAIYFKSAVSS